MAHQGRFTIRWRRVLTPVPSVAAVLVLLVGSVLTTVPAPPLRPVPAAAVTTTGPALDPDQPPASVTQVPAQVRPAQLVPKVPAVRAAPTGRVGTVRQALLPVGSWSVPDELLAAYRKAVAGAPASCQLSISLLAAIGQVESGSLAGRSLDTAHRVVPPVLGPLLDGVSFPAFADTDGGRLDGNLRWDRAVGPMQFIPSTWAGYGVDGDGDGQADPQNVYDATASAAGYLCAHGRDLALDSGLRSAILAYNHSGAYLAKVLDWARRFGAPSGGVTRVTDGGLTVPANLSSSASAGSSTAHPRPSNRLGSGTTGPSPAHPTPGNPATSPTGAPPSLTITGSTVAFGDVRLGTGPATAAVTLGASPGSSVHLSGFTLIPDVPGVGLDLSAPAACHDTDTLAPGATCTVALTFEPGTPGAMSTSLMIYSDAAAGPHSVPVSGVGTQARIAFSPPAGHDFGDQQFGVTSHELALTIHNPGTAPLTFTGPPVFSNSDFALAGHGDCTDQIAPEGSCTLHLTFTASALGVRKGILTMHDSASGGPHSYNVTGVGVQPAVALVPSALSFGQVPVGDTDNQAVALRNTGTDVLSVTDLSSTNAAVSVTSRDALPFTVAPGAVAALTVTFAPKAVGAVAATISVTDDAPGSPEFISVTGSGQAPADLAVHVVASLTSPKPRSSLTYTITLDNNGPTDAKAVRVVDTLPAAVTFSSVVAPDGVTCATPDLDTTGTVVCTLATMRLSATPIIIKIVTTVTAQAQGSFINTGTSTITEHLAGTVSVVRDRLNGAGEVFGWG